MENTEQNAKDFLSKTTTAGLIEKKGVGEYSMNFSTDNVASILVAYAASVSPKLVMPSEQTSKLIQIAASLLTDRLSEEPQEWHNDRKAPKWLIKRIVRFATLYNDKNRDRSRIIKEVVDELRRLNPSLFK